MKYYKDINNEVYAYEEDGSQDHLIGDKILITQEEVEEHINPPKTEAQILAEKVAEAKAYLANTGWYIERLNDPSSGKEVPQEVLDKRAEARVLINELEG